MVSARRGSFASRLEDRPPAGTPEVVTRVIRAARAHFQACADEARARAPALAGRVAVRWSADAGRVRNVSLIENTTGDEAFGRCVVQRTNALRLPAEVGGELAWAWEIAAP